MIQAVAARKILQGVSMQFHTSGNSKLSYNIKYNLHAFGVTENNLFSSINPVRVAYAKIKDMRGNL